MNGVHAIPSNTDMDLNFVVILTHFDRQDGNTQGYPPD